MQMIDPDKPLFDLIAFYGAVNVQNAVILIEKNLRRCIVYVGIEHRCVSPIWKDMAVGPMNVMC